jgi:hypothetical protein
VAVPDRHDPQPERRLEPYPDVLLEGLADAAAGAEAWYEAYQNGDVDGLVALPDPRTGIARASGLLVFALSGSQVSAITRFDDTVLPRFGVPAVLPR